MLEPQARTIQSEIADWLRSAPRQADDDFSEAELKQLRRRISEVQSATSNGFACLGLPLKLRALVAAILAASCGETRFKASYKTLVELLFREGDGRTYQAKKSEVRRLVKGLLSWQEQTSITLCTIQGGGQTKDDEGELEYHDTEFELVFLDAIAKALAGNPLPERMRAAVRLEIASMMKLPPFDGRYTPKQPTAEETQRRNEKASITMALKACEPEADAGRDPIARAEAIARKIVEAARDKFSGTPPHQEGVSDELSCEMAEVEWGGGVSNPTHPPAVSDSKLTPSRKALEVLKRNAEPEAQNLTPPVSLDAAEAQLRDTGGDSVEAVRACASVGVSVFKVLLKDDVARVAREEGDFDDFSLERHLPALIARGEAERRSVIVDMKANGRRIIQVDEAGPEVLKLLEPVSFMQVETSAGNGQAWIALPEGLSSEVCAEVTARLFARLKPLGANRGASGGLRWPGSINYKPGRNQFRIRMLRAAFGRVASPNELEAAGLLADPPEQAQRPKQAQQSSTQGAFPDYRRCLMDKDGDRSRADASFLKIASLRGIPTGEAVAELARVSGRVQDEEKRGRKDYVSRTVSFVES
jgi:hypothetical protein